MREGYLNWIETDVGEGRIFELDRHGRVHTGQTGSDGGRTVGTDGRRGQSQGLDGMDRTGWDYITDRTMGLSGWAGHMLSPETSGTELYLCSCSICCGV